LQDWLAWIAVLAAAILVVALYRWNRTAFFLASFAAITLVPLSNLLFLIGTIMAERFLYMPTIGLLACLVMAIYAAGKQVHMNRLAPVVLCVMTAAFAVRTWERNGDWQDERAMAEASVRTSPNSFKVHEMLASTLYANGTASSNLDRAIEEADRALAIIAEPNGPALNLACDLVHKQFCAASVEVVKAAIENMRWDVARQQKQNSLQKYGCPAGPLEKVLPD
jgi:hypothetical protein